MLVTLLGMMMEVRPVIPKKALSSMIVTSLGIIVFLHPAISTLEEEDSDSMMALQLLRES